MNKFLKFLKFNRRKFIWSFLIGLPAWTMAQAFWFEPEWIRIRRIRLSRGPGTHRLVHFTDLHHKGDRQYLQLVVKKVNQLKPEFVCFTGDIIEETDHLDEALSLLQQIDVPLYGVPGNHDYWSHADFEQIGDAFAATGGAWLVDRQTTTKDGGFNLIGATCQQPPHFDLKVGARNIMLIHYPEWADKLGDARFDLILAGHSHGGQVRIPGFGPLMLPYGVGKYDLGLFQTQSGPLYVNAGIGYFYINVRLFCRPEITVFEI